LETEARFEYIIILMLRSEVYNMGGHRPKSARSITKARPTSGRVLLALFNILESSGHMAGAKFLDLFSGAGDIAVGALDHGAASVTAVESDRALAGMISSRMSARGAEKPSRCICGDVRGVVPRLARDCKASGAFDVVFADPPYCMGWGNILPRLMEDNPSIISACGVFVLERSTREAPVEMSVPRDDRIYGETVLSFYWQDRAEGD
jgi:16S rRNA (guanine(966)-N(2))-methyltransferase RsmD